MFLIKHQVVKTATKKNIAKQENREWGGERSLFGQDSGKGFSEQLLQRGSSGFPSTGNSQ